jgi:hypothetical protein
MKQDIILVVFLLLITLTINGISFFKVLPLIVGIINNAKVTHYNESTWMIFKYTLKNIKFVMFFD